MLEPSKGVFLVTSAPSKLAFVKFTKIKATQMTRLRQNHFPNLRQYANNKLRIYNFILDIFQIGTLN
jgi:hypothetical protein